MENKYYIIDYIYNSRLNKNDFFIHELIPSQDFDFFVRGIEHPEIEYLGQDTWDGIVLYYGAMPAYVKINKKQGSLIRDLNIIKGYYTNIKEAEKDLEKLNNFIKEHESTWIF